MAEQDYDEKILAELIEKDKRIWEDGNHLKIELHDGGDRLGLHLARISPAALYHIDPHTIEARMVMNLIFEKVQEAGRVVQLDINATHKHSNMVDETIDKFLNGSKSDDES